MGFKTNLCRIGNLHTSTVSLNFFKNCSKIKYIFFGQLRFNAMIYVLILTRSKINQLNFWNLLTQLFNTGHEAEQLIFQHNLKPVFIS